VINLKILAIRKNWQSVSQNWLVVWTKYCKGDLEKLPNAESQTRRVTSMSNPSHSLLIAFGALPFPYVTHKYFPQVGDWNWLGGELLLLTFSLFRQTPGDLKKLRLTMDSPLSAIDDGEVIADSEEEMDGMEQVHRSPLGALWRISYLRITNIP